MSSDIDDLEEFNERINTQSTQVNENKMSITRTYSGEVPAEQDVLAHSTKIPDAHAQMWAVGGNTYFACENAVTSLPPGQYTIRESNAGIYFLKSTVNLDDLIALPDSASEQIISEIETFWTKEQHFRSFGFLWKRGMLMWGPPGSGKTSTVQMISANIIKRGGLSIYVDDPVLAAQGLQLLRQIEPKRPLVVMLEDIDAIIDNRGESKLLALLDGELQIDNVVFIATTNYPERLDKRFINRPSRFDVVKKIGMPSEDARRLYIKAKNTRLANQRSKEELNHWVNLTNGFSVAHLKELIVSVEVFEVPLQQAVDRLKTMIYNNPQSTDNDNKSHFGFTNK